MATAQTTRDAAAQQLAPEDQRQSTGFEWHAMTRDMEDPKPHPRPAPSVDDKAAASMRLLAVRLLLKRHGGNTRTWPSDAREQYVQMLEEQAQYEATFGKHA